MTSSPTYEATLRRLAGLARFGVRLGLDRVRGALQQLGAPHRVLRVVHVAGTNGKGSVAAMIAACLRAGGVRVGLYTSPHLCRFTERITVDGEEIPRRAVCRWVDAVLRVDPRLTFFEVVTAAALCHLVEAGVEAAVLETGLGGRLDATNVVERPEVCVITRIALDHRDLLGEQLGAIAAEKAGIIKPDAQVIAAPGPREVLEVLERRCAAVGARSLRVAGRDFPARSHAPLALAGSHQRENASLCLAAMEALSMVDETAWLQGLRRVRWPARMEWVDALHLVDGAHNADALAALAASLPRDERFALVLGMLGPPGRVAPADLAPLLDRCDRVVVTRPTSPRALDPQRVAALLPAGFSPRVAPDLRRALSLLRADRRRRVIAGSLYLAGEALALLRDEPTDPWPTADPL